MNNLSNRVVLALMAHPDDAEISCGGTLVRLAEAGWQIHIATLTPGDCGTTSETPWDISSTRTGEARKAAALIGAEYHCLDERDGLIVYDKPTARKCIDLFRKIAPSLIFTHPPKDYMIDHEMVSLLTRSASFLYAAPNASMLPLKPESVVPYLYYCDPLEGMDSMGQLIEPTTRIDISDQLEKKIQMLACHASQREWLRAHHGTDEYLDAVRCHAAMRGRQVGMPFAEAFVQHRGSAYPRNDLLIELFGPSTEKTPNK